jgi:DNA-binding transcriptional LysR family regulator
VVPFEEIRWYPFRKLAGTLSGNSALETLKYLVAGGNGSTFIPELALYENKKMKGLINYYPFIEKNAQREIALFTRDQYPRPDEIRLLYQKMKDHLPEFKT